MKSVPASRRSFSMRVRRFSSASIYLALSCVSRARTKDAWTVLPLWRRPFLFNLGEDAFGLVVSAMSARWQLAVTLDLFPSTLVTGLEKGHRKTRLASRAISLEANRSICAASTGIWGKLTLAILLLLASWLSSSSKLESANICAVMSGGSCCKLVKPS